MSKSVVRKIQNAIAERYEHDSGPTRHVVLVGPYGEALAVAEHKGEVALFACYDQDDDVGQVNLDTRPTLEAVLAAVRAALGDLVEGEGSR